MINFKNTEDYKKLENKLRIQSKIVKESEAAATIYFKKNRVHNIELELRTVCELSKLVKINKQMEEFATIHSSLLLQA